MSHIQGVHFKNFMPFRGEFDLELGPKLYGVFAQHADNKLRSNGLGKSSFAGGLRWCLSNKKPQNAGVELLDDMISRGEDDVEVVLELSDGARAVRSKTRGKAARFSLFMGGRELKDDEAQEELDKMLGISDGDRLTTCWALQKDLDLLTRDSSTSGVLTKMVEDWLGPELERLIAAGESVSCKLGEQIKAHQKALEELADVEAVAERLGEHLQEVRRLEVVYDDEKRVYDDELKKKLSVAKRAELSKKIEEIGRVRAELGAMGKLRAVPELAGYEKAYEEAAASLQTKDVEFERQGAEVSRLKKLAAGEFDGACPVSAGFECPARGQINARSAPNRTALKDATEGLLKLGLARRELELEKARARGDLGGAREELAVIQRASARKKIFEDREDALEKEIEESKAVGLEPLDEEEAVAPVVFPNPPDRSALARAEMALENARTASDGLPQVREEAERLGRTVRAHRLAAELLGPAKARRVVLERVVRTIDASANERLYESNIPLKVESRWGRETKELAEQCSGCGAAFPKSAKVKRCERCGAARGPKISHEFSWGLSFVSGAGLDLGGLGLRVAGYRFLKLHRGAVWSVAVLDEPTAQMDRVMRSSVAAGIRRLLAGTFEQGFLTAHDPSTLESCEGKILIRASGDDPVRSTIEVVR